MGKRERLDKLLVERRLVASREEGRGKILAGEVWVNDRPVTKAGTLVDEDVAIRVKRLGVPDRFIPHGTQDELRKICGFDKDAISQATLQIVRRGKKRNREGWERGSA